MKFSPRRGACLLLIVSSLFGGITQAAAESQSPLWYTQTDLKLDKKVQSYVLSNGMRIVLVPNRKPKQSVVMRLWVNAGSLQENGNVPGVAHFLEHMAFNGSTNVPEGQMIEMLERHGLAFGADTNATTDLFYTVYKLDLPKNDQESLNTALFLLRETASELTLSPEAIEREKPVILAEHRESNTAGLANLVEWGQYIYQDAGLYDRLPIGTEAGIRSTTQKNLRDFYAQNYHPKNMTLVIAGDFDEKALQARIRHYFSGWVPEQPFQHSSSLQAAMLPENVEALAFLDSAVTPRIGINLIQPGTADSARSVTDDTERRVNEFVRFIGMNALMYRLETQTLTSQGRLMDPDVSNMTELTMNDVFSVSVGTRPGEWAAGLQLLEQTIRQVVQHGFTQQEIARQITSLQQDLKNNVSQSDDFSSLSYAEQIVNGLNNRRVIISTEDELALFEQHQDRITTEAVNQMMRQMLTASPARLHLADSVAGEIQEGQDPRDALEKAMLAAYEHSQAQPVTPFSEKQTTEFAYQYFGKPGKAKQVKQSAFGDIVSYRFDNGVVLNVKPTDLEKNVVYLNVRVGRGWQELPPEQAVLITLFNTGFVTGGLQAHDMNELRGMLTGKSLGMNLNLNEDAIVGSYRSTREAISEQLKLYAAFFTHPAYRQEGMDFAEQHVSAYWQGLYQSPESLEMAAISQLMRQNDPRIGVATPQELEGKQLSDLHEFVSRSLTEGPIEIALVGDITPARAVKLVGETFGALKVKAQEPKHQVNQTLRPYLVDEQRLYHQGESHTALASAYWPIPDAMDFQQLLVFQALQEVAQLKLNKTVREQAGASYSPWVERFQSGSIKNFGYLALHSNTELSRVDDILSAYPTILQDIRQGKVSEDELTRALGPLLEKFALMQQDNGYWLSVASTAYSAPDEVENEKLVMPALKALTVKDIQAAAQIIPLEAMMKVKVLPEG